MPVPTLTVELLTATPLIVPLTYPATMPRTVTLSSGVVDLIVMFSILKSLISLTLVAYVALLIVAVAPLVSSPIAPTTPNKPTI